jgi:hypothetical protein
MLMFLKYKRLSLMRKLSYFLAAAVLLFFYAKANAENISYEDRYAIYDLINSYSYGIDYYDTDMLLTLFASDAVFKVNMDGELINTREGLADLQTEFSERAERRIQNGAGSGHHFITNIVIEMPRAGFVTGKTMAIVTNKAPGDNVGLSAHGMYEWTFKKEGSNWKIASLELFYN